MQENKSQNAIFIIERLKSTLNYENDSDLYNALNIKQSTLSAWKNRGIGDYDTIITFCNKMNLDLNFILSGKEDNSSATIIPMKSGTGIPFVLHRAVAGFGSGNFTIEERDVKDYYVIPKFKHKKIDFMIEVEGSSMYPKYNSGDVVACKIIQPDRFIQWNKTHVIATKEQGIIIKRIKPGTTDKSLTMISDNQHYDPFEVDREDITGLALVVGVIRLE